MEKSKVISFILGCICLIGCIWQLSAISSVFLQYGVLTSVSMEIPSLIPAPAVTACYRYTDIMNQPKLESKFSVHISNSGSIFQSDGNPTTEAPKVEMPKTEAPKTGIPKTEIPKNETPKTETLKVKNPKSERLVTEVEETQMPKIETPNPETSKTETSNPEIPKTETPNGKAVKMKLNDEGIRFVQTLVSVADIFSLTPSTNEAIEGCTLRTPGSFKILNFGRHSQTQNPNSQNPENRNPENQNPGNRNPENQSSDTCLTYFKVTKFFLLEYICYRYIYIGKDGSTLFTFDELANAPAGPGAIYEVAPGSNFSEYKITKMIAHEAYKYPYEATSFSPVLDRDVTLEAKEGEKGTVEKFNSFSGAKFILTYFVLKEERLEPPFETNCFDYGSIKAPITETKTDCHQMCVRDRVIRTHNRVPFSSIIIQSLTQRVISYNDLRDESLLNHLFSLHRLCSEICSKPDCIESTTFTKIRTRPKGRLAMRMTISDSPSISINYKPVMRAIEYFIYILSTLGVWFGVSIYGIFNPFKSQLRKSEEGSTKSKPNAMFQKRKNVVNCDQKISPIEKYLMNRILLLESKMYDMQRKRYIMIRSK